MRAFHLPVRVPYGTIGTFAFNGWEHWMYSGRLRRLPPPQATGNFGSHFLFTPVALAAWPLTPGVCRGRPVALRANYDSATRVRQSHVIMFLLGRPFTDHGLTC